MKKYCLVNKDKGVTLIELLVAMATASIVVLLLYGGYLTIFKNYLRYKDKTTSLNNAWLLYSRIDNLTQRSYAVAPKDSAHWGFYRGTGDSIVLSKQGRALFLGENGVSGLGFVDSFSISLKNLSGYAYPLLEVNLVYTYKRFTGRYNWRMVCMGEEHGNGELPKPFANRNNRDFYWENVQ